MQGRMLLNDTVINHNMRYADDIYRICCTEILNTCMNLVRQITLSSSYNVLIYVTKINASQLFTYMENLYITLKKNI